MATVEIDTSVSQAKFEKSDYAQVLFHNIAETYPIDTNIDCHYSISPILVPTSRDWVGLYKVGWSSSKEYVYFEWSPSPNSGLDKQEEFHILFPATNLPKDDGEFYQFCYVTRSGQIRGASTPFQFKRPSADDFVEIEDEDGEMLVIKSKTVALQDDLKIAEQEKNDLIQMKCVLEAERESLLTKLVECERKVATEQKVTQSARAETQKHKEKIDTLNHEARDMTLVLESLTEKITTVNKEKESILTRLDENDQYIKKLRDEIKSLSNERDAANGKVKMLEEEKELFKNHFTASESTLQGYLVELDSLRKQLAEKDQEKAQRMKAQEKLQGSMEEERKKLERQLTVSKSDKECIDDLTECLKNTEDKLAAAEHCKKLLNEEVNAVQMAHKKMSDGFEEAKSEVHSMKVKMDKQEEKYAESEMEFVSHLAVIEQEMCDLKLKDQEKLSLLQRKVDSAEEEIVSLKKLVETMTKQIEEMEDKHRDETEGPLYALKTAQAHLKERYAKMRAQNDDIKKQLDELLHKQQSWKQTELDMQREIADLKLRLQMGAEEYKVKYIECKKLQTELRKMQKQISKSERRSEERKISTDVVVQIEPLQRAAGHTQVQENGTQAGAVQRENGTQAAAIQRESSTQAAATQQEISTQATADHQENGTQMERTVTSEASTESEPELVDMSQSELQLQLDDLGRELEHRSYKKQKYKTLYQDEKEKRMYLEKHYYEELKCHQDKLARMTDNMQDMQNDHYHKITELQSIIHKQKEEIDQLNDQLSQKKEIKGTEHTRIAYPPQTTSYPNPCSTTEMTTPITTPPTTSFLKYGNPYEKEMRRYTPPSQSPPPEPILTPPTLPPRSSSTASAPEFAMAGSTDSGEMPAALSTTLLKPLPAPLQPELLPSAKIAAVLAKCDGQPEAVESSHGDLPSSPSPAPESVDGDEERFIDADGEPQKFCPLCSMTFPIDLCAGQINLHMESHYGPTCPMCSKQFNKDFKQEEYEEHVQNHFQETD